MWDQVIFNWIAFAMIVYRNYFPDDQVIRYAQYIPFTTIIVLYNISRITNNIVIVMGRIIIPNKQL